MHHGHGPHGHSGHSPHGPHGKGHSPHGGHGHSPHGGHGPHGHGSGHSPHGGHGIAHDHEQHDKHNKHDKNLNDQKVTQFHPHAPPQPIPQQSFPQPQSIPQPKALIINNAGYSSQQAVGSPQQPTYTPQLPGYSSQQGGNVVPQAYPGQHIYPVCQPQQLKAPDSAHEHPLNYTDSVNSQCKICKQELGGQPGYTCGSCKVILCLNCAQKIFYGEKKYTIHAHPLLLKDRNSWKCDLCKQNYKNVASFYCKQCDFDACSACYVSY